MTAPATGLMRAGSAMLTGTVASRALGFLYPVALSRMLTIDQFAAVMFAIATSFVAAQAAASGVPVALARLVAADESPHRRGAWVVLAAIGTGLLLILSLAVSALISFSASQSVVFGALIVVGLTADALYFAVLQGLRQFRLNAIYRTSANLVQLIGVLALAGVADVTPMWAVTLYASSYFVPMAVLELKWRTVRSNMRFTSSLPPRGHPDYPTLTALARPALGSALCYAAIVGADVFFVERLAPSVFPAYSAGRSLALIMTFVPFSLGMVVMPRVAGLDLREAGSELKRALLASLAASVVIGGGLFAFAPLAVGVAFPENLQAASVTVRWLLPGFALLGTYSVFSQWWMGIGRPRMAARVLLSAGIVGLAAYPAAIRTWGAPGAGLALMSASTWAVGLMALLTRRLLLSCRSSEGLVTP